MKRFLVAAGLAAALLCGVSGAASAKTRVAVRSIGEDWCVEVILAELPQRGARAHGRRGGVARERAMGVEFLETWIAGTTGQW